MTVERLGLTDEEFKKFCKETDFQSIYARGVISILDDILDARRRNREELERAEERERRYGPDI